ncbi:LmeA family phospholipid-binding protein [Williamsia sp. M5A3_1d]
MRGTVMRKALVCLAVALVVLVVGALAVDTAFAMNAERSFARALMESTTSDGESPGLRYEPEVTISGFPATRSILDGHYSAIGITARAVDATGTTTFGGSRQPRMARSCDGDDPCHVDVRSRLRDVRVGGPRSLTNPFPRGQGLSVGSASASTTLDSVAVGRFLGIDDLTINTPAPRGKAGGGGPQDGLLSRTTGILLTGTVATASVDDRRVKVSVNVDLSIRRGLLHLQATGFYDGPEEHSDTVVAPAEREGVLARFTATLPRLPMAWGAEPGSARSSGSDLMIEGTAHPQVFAPMLFLNASQVYWMFRR